MDKEQRRKYDREWKQRARKNNTEYSKRVIESKRSDHAKMLRAKNRSLPENKEKERLYAKVYRQRHDVKLKNNARSAVRYAIANGKLSRPSCCEKCGLEDKKLKDGRSGLRADHHKGYERENWLNILFICVSCDGKQLRKHT